MESISVTIAGPGIVSPLPKSSRAKTFAVTLSPSTKTTCFPTHAESAPFPGGADAAAEFLSKHEDVWTKWVSSSDAKKVKAGL